MMQMLYLKKQISTTGSLEGAYAIQNNLDISTWAGFSEQELVSCDVGGEDDGCNGGLMDSAFTWITSKSLFPRHQL
jgi:hypothetical protein